MARQTSYTVHLPPTGSDEAAQFVPDSFAPIAFVAPWAWFPFHRMWLVTIAYLVALAVVAVRVLLCIKHVKYVCKSQSCMVCVSGAQCAVRLARCHTLATVCVYGRA